MDNLLSISKDVRIEKRRERIKKKLNSEEAILDKSKNEIRNEKGIVDHIESEMINKNEDKMTYKFEYENIEYDLNYDNLRKEIVKNFDEKKNDLLKDLSTNINIEEKPFLEDIKKYVIELSENNFMINSNEKTEKLKDSLNDIYNSNFQNNVVEINNLAIKEKETYKKKVEKYFCLLKYKDEKIKKLCQIKSKKFSSFINLMKNQIESYKIYLEDILNKTRDNLNLRRKCLLDNNKQILGDFIRMKKLNSYNFVQELKSEMILIDKIKKKHEQNHLDLKTKNELLEKNLKMNMNYIEDINHIIMNKEKNLYNGKILQQKNNHNIKMINFYKLEINKLREALLSVKTYYYNYKIKSKKNIHELINHYERIKFQFIELQKRQRSYEQNFQKKYTKAWELQKNETNKCIEKLLNANEIICEQIFLKEISKTNYKCIVEEKSNLTTTTYKDNEKFKTHVSNRKVSDYQIENVKKLLLQECNFLDDNVEDEEEKLRKILKYIGVHNRNDLELLTELFYLDDEEEKEKVLCSNAEYTLDIIFKYYQEKEKENLCKITKNKEKYKNRLTISLKLAIERKKKEKEYWNNLAHIIPDDIIELWKTFLIFVEKYYHLLKERSNIIENIFIENKLIKENLNKINEMRESIKKL